MFRPTRSPDEPTPRVPSSGAAASDVAAAVSPTGGTGDVRTVRALLTDRSFGLYFLGSLANNLGTWFHSIAVILVVYQLTGSALVVGVVSGAQFGATLVLAPVAGVLLDRVDRRRLMALAQVGSAIAAAILMGSTLTDRLSVPVIFAATAVIGVGEAFSVPTKQALVPSLVGSGDVGQALALQSLSFNIARALGPALGAAVVATGGAAWAFGANLVSYLLFIGVLAVIRPRPVVFADGDRSLRAGLRYVRGHRAIRLHLVTLAAISFALDPVTTLAPSLVEELGGDSNLVGLLVSAFGIGAAAMALFGVRPLQRHVPDAAGTIGLTAFGLGMLGVALAPGPAVVLAALIVAGAGFLLGNNDITSRIQRSVDDRLRGRVMALWAMVLLGPRPIAGVIAGSITDVVGPRPAIAIPAVGILVASRVSWRHRGLDGSRPNELRPR